MKKRIAFAKSGFLLTSTQVICQLCSLGRNIIIARLISPSDFGIASILLLVISFLEMISNLSLEKLLIQSPHGNEEKFENVAHLLQAIRGVVSFLILVILAGPVSTLFSIPQAKQAFYVLSFIPLINGFLHLDPRRMERDMRFWPQASVEMLSQVVMLLFAWPAVKWLPDYRSMLVLLLIKAFIIVFGSHFVAERKYGWSQDKQYAKRFMYFGWPLIINGLLMFGVFQGDRFIIGSAKKIFGSDYGMTDVGLYSAAFMLAMMPALLCIRVCTSLFLPVLSRMQHSSECFNSQCCFVSQLIAVIVVTYGTVMIFTGDNLLSIVYGENYAGAGHLVGWLSIMWAMRIVRALSATISMAKGNTKILMYTNFARLFFLIGVVMIVILEMEMIWVAIVGAIGEFFAYWLSLYLNKKILRIPLAIFIPSELFIVTSLITSIVLKIVIFDQLKSNANWFILIVFTSLAIPASGFIYLSILRKNIVRFKQTFNNKTDSL